MYSTSTGGDLAYSKHLTSIGGQLANNKQLTSGRVELVAYVLDQYWWPVSK